MDKLSIISGALFFAADVFATASLAMPNWIVSEVGGKLPNITMIVLIVDFLFENGYLDLYFDAYRAESYWFAADMCHNLWKRNDLFYSRNPSGRMGYNIPVYSRGGYMCYNNNHPPGRFLLEVQRHEVCPLARVCCK